MSDLPLSHNEPANMHQSTEDLKSQLDRTQKRMTMLNDVNHLLDQSLSLDQTISRIMDIVIHMAGADRGLVMLRDAQGQSDIKAIHNLDPQSINEEVSRVIEDVVNRGEPVKQASVICVPLNAQKEAVGVMYVDTQKQFNDHVSSLLATIARLLSLKIENSRLYQALEETHTSKNEFVSVVTHELRIPMTSIKGYTDMILMSGDVTERQKNFLDIIRSNVERMSLLISNLSDISRIESDRLQLDIEENVRLWETLQEVLPALKEEIESREHTLELAFSDDLCPVKCDSRRLGQIFTNLISNAYKYTPNGGVITVKTEQLDGFAQCSVSDTGIGMTPEELSHLFTKFWRGEAIHVREQNGTGLGLIISKNLVELQGGEMTVESKPDEGTTFSFTIPCS